jgi:hypothetical protein
MKLKTKLFRWEALCDRLMEMMWTPIGPNFEASEVASRKSWALLLLRSFGANGYLGYLCGLLFCLLCLLLCWRESESDLVDESGDRNTCHKDSYSTTLVEYSTRMSQRCRFSMPLVYLYIQSQNTWTSSSKEWQWWFRSLEIYAILLYLLQRESWGMNRNRAKFANHFADFDRLHAILIHTYRYNKALLVRTYSLD